MKYIVIAIVLIIVLLAILKATKKDAGLDFNKLVELLGGKDNIISTETNMSRFKVILKDALFNTIGEGVVSLKKTYDYLNGVEIDASVEKAKLEHPLAIIDKWKDVPIKNRLILNEIQHLFIELFAKSKNISVKNAELFVSYIIFE